MTDAKKILVADDSVTIQKVIRLALSHEGYDIQAVSKGSDALETLPLFRPDIVLIDVSLPEKGAFEIIQKARQDSLTKHTKFVLMSSSYDQIPEEELKSNPLDGRLTKPFDPTHLRKVIHQCLGIPDQPRSKPNPLAKPQKTPPPPPPPEPPELSASKIQTPSSQETKKPSALSQPPSPPSLQIPPPPPIDLSASQPKPALPPSPPQFTHQNRPPLPKVDEDEKSFSEDVSQPFAQPPEPPHFQSTEPVSSHFMEEDVSDEPTLSGDLWESESFQTKNPDVDHSSSFQSFDQSSQDHSSRGEALQFSESVSSDAPSKESDSNPAEDFDIRQLTEETIHMAGVDQFDWAVQDNALKFEPPAPPSQSKQQMQAQAQIQKQNQNQNQNQVKEPVMMSEEAAEKLHYREPEMDPYSQFEVVDSTFQFSNDAMDSHLNTEASEPYLEKVNRESQFQSQNYSDRSHDLSPPAFNENPTSHKSFNNHPGFEKSWGQEINTFQDYQVSQDQIKEVLKSELEATVLEMAKEMLPHLAEKIIRSEINKLLSEPPEAKEND
jgi:CheY-like chemotaxis protein